MTSLQKTVASLLSLLATSGALACNPAQGSGQCGFIGANGWVGTKEEQIRSYQQPNYNAPTYYDYVPSYTPYTPPQPIRESRYGAFAIIETQLTALADVKQAEATYVLERGESQQATKDKDAAFAAFEKWVSEFYAIAKIALEDKPQLL